MWTALLASVSFVVPASGASPVTLELTPTDDIWVYPHASDPQKDPFLRVWGSGGGSVAPRPEDSANYSYSYLRFSLPKLPAGAKLKRAQLTLLHVADPGHNKELLAKTPLEARALIGGFAEKGWSYGDSMKVVPKSGKDAVFGFVVPAKPAEEGKEFAVTLDLMKGPASFGAYLAENPSGFGLALTSALDVEELGMKAILKFYSKDAQKESQRPKLTLEFE